MILGHGLQITQMSLVYVAVGHRYEASNYVCCCTVQVNGSSNNSLLAQLHAERAARAAQAAAQPSAASTASSGQPVARAQAVGSAAAAPAPLPTITLLTYNVWCVLHLCLSLSKLVCPKLLFWDVQCLEDAAARAVCLGHAAGLRKPWRSRSAWAR